MGEILYSIDYSNIIFGCFLYDNDLGSYIDESSGSKAPFGNLSYSTSKDLPTFKKIILFSKEESAKSSGPPTDWIWIWLPPGFVHCFKDGEIDLGCLIDPWTDNGEGGGGGGFNPDIPCWKQRTKGDCYLCCSYWLSKGMDQWHWVTLVTLFTLDKLCINYAWMKYTKCTDRCDEEYSP